MEIFNIISILAIALAVCIILYSFYKVEWGIRKLEQKERVHTPDGYRKDYKKILDGICFSRHLSHIDTYREMILRFEIKYKGTVHESNSCSDVKILLDLCEGKENLLTGYMRPIFN